MQLITWNIQWGKGCDGVVDLKRIVATAKALADADVFCFQEVSDNFAVLDGGVDQAAELAAMLPDYRPVFLPAVETIDSEGRSHRFGNMTLSRLPVLQIANHLLPWMHDEVPKSMRRSALEVTVQASAGPIRIVNTHLEYYSRPQREAQIVRLLDLQEAASRSSKSAAANHVEPYGSQTVAPSSLLCGDFNFDVSDPQYALLHRRFPFGPQLSRRVGISLSGSASPVDLRTARSCSMEKWSGLPGFCLCIRGPDRPRHQHEGRRGNGRVRSPADPG